MTPAELPANIVERHAQRPFLVDAASGRSWTYETFHHGVGQLVEHFREAGLRRGDRVALLLNNSPEFAACYFACLYEGLVAVPINPLSSPRDIAYELETSAVNLLGFESATKPLVPPEVWRRPGLRFLQLVLRQASVFALKPEAQAKEVASRPSLALQACMSRTLPLSIDEALVPAARQGTSESEHPTWSLTETAQASGWQPGRPCEEDLFVITFTSGTTSRPKGVCHTAGSMLRAATAFNAANCFGPDTRLYHVMNMAYMAGLLNTLLCPFLAGGLVAIDSAFQAPSAWRFWAAPQAHRLNTLWLVPTMLATLLKLDRDLAGTQYCREHVRHVCVGTAPLPRKLQLDFESRYGVRLLESYGLSESLFIAANSPADEPVAGSVGRTLAGVELRLRAGENPRPNEGEFEVRTPFQMDGYLDPQSHRPEPTEPNAWFRTGDVGVIGADGRVFITGRAKDLIIRGGVNISPRGVEEALLQHAAVEDAAVIGVPHEFYGEEVLALVKLRSGHSLDQVRQGLLDVCLQTVGKGAAPSRFEHVSELPRNSIGKIQKAELRLRYANSAAGVG